MFKFLKNLFVPSVESVQASIGRKVNVLYALADFHDARAELHEARAVTHKEKSLSATDEADRAFTLAETLSTHLG